MVQTLAQLAEQLDTGTLGARDHVETCLDVIDTPGGKTAFMTVNAEEARAQADEIDHLRRSGVTMPPLAGLALSVKDLFDIKGETTRAGSRVLADAPPAVRDAEVVARLRAAGLVIIGRTNMTEFAFSGLGMNPHYGNPTSPYGRDEGKGRISGGSSSGSAVSIADGMAAATIGTDTGGSTRAPAAFCGIVGLKPTTSRIPSRGVYPLAPSIDAAGPMGASVACCMMIDDIMAGNKGRCEDAAPVAGLRLAVPRGYLFDDLDDEVGRCFDAATARLSAAGAHIEDVRLDVLEELRPANRAVSIVSYEAHETHRGLLGEHGDGYDPYIAKRLRAGADIGSSDYVAMRDERKKVRAAVQRQARQYDALVLPTCPCIPPAIRTLAGIDAKLKVNARVLRNTAMANYLDRPSISLPCHRRGDAPVGFMLVGATRQDRRLLAIARGVEGILGR